MSPNRCNFCSKKTMGIAILVIAGLAIAAVLVGKLGAAPAAEPAKIGLEGFCPVCIVNMKKWVPGSEEHQATYDGVTYRFPSEKVKETFLADPAKFVPALGGDCTVCLVKGGKRMAGNIRHGSFFRGRLYLFAGDKERELFRKDPGAYADVDLALDGHCAVCLANGGEKVPGKPEFTAIHKGMRYRFPSDKERRAFLASPDKYAVQPADETSVADAGEEDRAIDVEGTSGCAACEHGVTPLGTPNLMGLAVDVAGGEVYVIENAHKLYPEVYKDRFSGLPLRVSGDVLQRRGKITWIQPHELTLLNEAG